MDSDLGPARATRGPVGVWVCLMAGLMLGTGAPPATAAPPPAFVGPLAGSATAARATAASNPMCGVDRLGPYYWEIGDKTGALLIESDGVGPDDPLSIASGSKWVYAAYVVQRRGGTGRLDAEDDVPFLNFTSGYDNMGNGNSAAACAQWSVWTVDDCLQAVPGADQQNSHAVGKFAYDSGHMQVHGSRLGLGGMNAPALSTEIGGKLGVNLTYAMPLLAGGVYTSASTYAAFLRRLMDGSLKLGSGLDAQAVCTNPTDTAHGCSPSKSLPGPIPSEESWHYALGHWIEDDPAVGDGAYSSPGSLGFYPWIDAQRQYYGVLARQQEGDQQGYASAQCGRLLRQAWLSGKQQRGEVPE